MLGGKSTPAVGFAAGIERLLMVLEEQKIDLPQPVRPFLFIASADEEGQRWAAAKVIELRQTEIPAETDYLARSLKAQMREADRQEARFSIVIGTNEIHTKNCQVKNMSTGEMMTIPLSSLVDEVKKLQSRNT